MSAIVGKQEQQAEQQKQDQYKGKFKKGFDPRRHIFTKEECSDGFWAAIESVVVRYPDAIMPDGRHIVCNFLKAVTARKMVN